MLKEGVCKGAGNLQLTEQTLRKLYVEEGLSVTEIEREYNLARNTVTRGLKKYKIPFKETIHETATEYLMQKLQEFGYKVQRLGCGDLCDLLVEKQVRVKVMSSAKLCEDGAFRYALAEKQKKRPYTRSCYVLPNGRVRRRYSLFCDVVAFVGADSGRFYVWFIPAEEIADSLQTLRLPVAEQSKYNKYREAYGTVDTYLLKDRVQIG